MLYILKKIILIYNYSMNIVWRIILDLKSKYYTYIYIDEGKGKFVFKSRYSKVKMFKNKGAKIILNGKLIFEDIFSNNNCVMIRISQSGVFKIDGDFTIGNGVKIILNVGSVLQISGALKETSSGITSNTIIMVNENIKIGYDFLCSWDCFITDSDWHKTDCVRNTLPVIIGDHVWIATSVKILKGCNINNNCIIASGAVLHRKNFEKNSLIAGNPANVIKTNVSWSNIL